jgi:flagellar hook-length control protein FliK
MVAVTQNIALNTLAVPLGASAALPVSAAVGSVKENGFLQVLALVDAAVLDIDAAISTPVSAATDLTAKSDQPEQSTEPTKPDNAAWQPFVQFLVAPAIPVVAAPTPHAAVAAPASAQIRPHMVQAALSDSAVPDPITPMPNARPLTPNVAVAEPAPLQIRPDMMQATLSERAVPYPITPIPDQALPMLMPVQPELALDQPPVKAATNTGSDVAPQARSTASANPINLKPLQPKEIAPPVLVQSTRSPNNIAWGGPTLSDDSHDVAASDVATLEPVSGSSSTKNAGADLQIARAAGIPSPPETTQIPPTGTPDGLARPPARAAPDTRAIGQPSDQRPKPDASPSTAENAWRQKWIGRDQPAVTKDIVMGEETTLLTKDTSGNLASGGTSQLQPQKLAVVALPQTLTSAYPDAVPQLNAPPTTAVMQDASLLPQPTDAPIVLAPDAKPTEIATPDKPGFEMPNIAPAMPLPSIGVSAPTGPPLGVVAYGIPPALAPTIIEMTKSGNDGPLELALAPEELGRLTISIRHEGESVRVTMIAERPETLDLLRRHAGDLVADLRQAGFSGTSLSFGHSGQGQSARFAENPQADKDPTPSQPPPSETKLPAPSRSSKGSGMDLRL